MSKYHSGFGVEEITDILKNRSAHIHFIGVGGAGMFPLFKLTASLGYKVSGSDISDSELLHSAKDAVSTVYTAHNRKNVYGASLVVYTLAINEDNPELIYAEEAKIPSISRAEYLGAVMRMYEKRIGVSGTHGKSTTVAMLDSIFKLGKRDHTTVSGAALNDTGVPCRIGGLDTLIYEACEYKDSFLRFSPSVALFLNLEFDHADYFPDIEAVKASFLKAANTAELCIINGDDGKLREIAPDVGGRVVTFGMSSEADYRVLILNSKCGKYKVRFTFNGERLFDATLAVPGVHNVMNACAACAAARICGIECEIIKMALESFSGVPRRLENIGSYNGAAVYYDYAHHPTEIEASIKAVREMTRGRLTVIFKPHTYSRTAALMDELAAALSLADRVLLTDISAIRESEIYGVTSEVLVSLITTSAEYVADENVISRLSEIKGGAIIIMGAANLDKVKDGIKNEKCFDKRLPPRNPLSL